jgi:carboxyl-terminal processing protease
VRAPGRAGRGAARTASLCVILVLALSHTLPAQTRDSTRRPVRKPSVAEDLQMFSQVLNQIRVNHPDSIDTHRLFMAAVQGMVTAADPHSFVIPAVRLDPAKEDAFRAGRLHPVPVAFRFVGRDPIVVSVATGSRAAKQDILPGDELLAIDGQPVVAESAIELEVSLAGPRGSAVTLTLERRRLDGTVAQLDRVVQREKYEEASALPVAVMLDAQTGYVRVTTFANDRVAEDLHAALVRLERAGLRRLVLDLRDNGGGSVQEAARIAGEFLPAGTLVYTTAGKKKEVATTGRVSRSFWRRERRYPIVVLVNAGTASASELVAGALQDHDRALVVGKPTFGKALVMSGFPLTDGSVFVLVIGHVTTPCGRVVQRQYREITRRDYFRLASAERDTAGRPSCRTTGGRIVYGGGGIYPDVVLRDAPRTPLWLARAREQDLVVKWVNGYLSEHPDHFGSIDAIAGMEAPPAAALADFRSFAAREGHTVPDGQDSDTVLGRALLREVAHAKFGDPGYYRVIAAHDPEVTAAVQAFDRAEAILRK